MRSFLAGLLIVALSSAAMGQVRGEVESIGFEGCYRPDCWTRLVVRLQSQISEPAEYSVEIHERDLDFDHVIYTQGGITLNGHAEQRWEICFLPDPTGGGLPDNLADLQQRLRVYVTEKDHGRQIAQLPITTTVTNLDSARDQFHSKGTRLVLYVADGSSKPAWKDYDRAVGLQENVVHLPIDPRNLPQSALAYQAVDAVVWISGDARLLSQEGSKQLVALQQWVKQGGSLVVCQPDEGNRQRIEPFADMLPVVLQENGAWKVLSRQKSDLEPLTSIANKWNRPERRWRLTQQKFTFARATELKPGAEVDQWIDWDDRTPDEKAKLSKDKAAATQPAPRFPPPSPYIARSAYGLGCVTWVAQDLGNPNITGPRTMGWPYVWDRVLGWKNDTHVPADTDQATDDAYRESFMESAVDLGYPQLRGVEFGAKGAGLIVLAIFFFIIYWIIAGPGMYFLLAGRNRKQHTWTAFGFTAVAATALTVLLVRVVLRGSPEIHHSSLVRMVNGQEPQPALVFSRVGLYIPRDGDQRVSMSNTSNQFISYITPMAVNPAYVPDNQFPANLDYRVPVREDGATTPPAIDVPFRSTLKKLQARWAGDISAGIRGNNVRLKSVPSPSARDFITGTLDNLTGIDLKNIYIAFHYPGQKSDYLLYVPKWPSSGTEAHIDLGKAWADARQLSFLGYVADQGQLVTPDPSHVYRGELQERWAYYWYGVLGKGQDRFDDWTTEMPVSVPMLSFFDRIQPSKKSKDSGTANLSALALLRRGARRWDMSPALEACELVVVAQADKRPLPFPLQVNGDPVGGEGTVIYQFALPMDHSSADDPRNSLDEAQP